jgi:hypothetical protein
LLAALEEALSAIPPNPPATSKIISPLFSSNYSNYQVREMQDKNGKVIAYSAYNPNTGNNILMKPEELSTFKASVENISFWFLCLSAGVLPRFLLLLSAKLPSP